MTYISASVTRVGTVASTVSDISSANLEHFILNTALLLLLLCRSIRSLLENHRQGAFQCRYDGKVTVLRLGNAHGWQKPSRGLMLLTSIVITVQISLVALWLRLVSAVTAD